MKEIKTTARWVIGEDPKKDGEYSVITGYDESQLRITSLNYTVVWGWNTTDRNHEHPFNNDGYVNAWLDIEIPAWGVLHDLVE